MGGRKQKGQITILLVLVIVLLIVFGLMFFIKGGLVKDILSGAKGALSAGEAKTKFTESVEACIQHATQEGLILVGRQGGAIYNTQVEGTAPFIPAASSGELTLPVEYDDTSYDVSYAIREHSLNDAPDYPFQGWLSSTPAETFIGKSTIIPLCDANGPNAWGIAGAEYTCISYDPLDNPPSISPHSIQDYLRVYILNKTLECMNLSEWASQYGVGIVPQGDAELEAIIGDSDVTARLTYPLQVGGSAVRSFVYQSNVRLKKVYELAYKLAERDNSDLTLFVDEEASVTGLHACPSVDRMNNIEPCLKPGMNVTVIDAPCTGCKANRFADIVRITDENSLVVGEPYVFQFARENRRPALDQIDETKLSGKYELYLEMTHGIPGNPYLNSMKNPTDYQKYYDVLVTEGDDIVIIPYGLDPDEDELTYYYEGWRTGSVLSDHHHQLNHSCHGSDPPCMDPFSQKEVSNGMTGSINHWEQAAQGDDWRTHWTSSPTTSDDVGYKLLRIKVCDILEGLCDWQDIGILVNDKPIFNYTFTDNADTDNECCTDCKLIIDSEDNYYASYHIEMFDEENQNDCGDVTINNWLTPVPVTFPPADGRCSSLPPSTLITVRVTDDFGSFYEDTFSTCP